MPNPSLARDVGSGSKFGVGPVSPDLVCIKHKVCSCTDGGQSSRRNRAGSFAAHTHLRFAMEALWHPKAKDTRPVSSQQIFLLSLAQRSRAQRGTFLSQQDLCAWYKTAGRDACRKRYTQGKCEAKETSFTHLKPLFSLQKGEFYVQALPHFNKNFFL